MELEHPSPAIRAELVQKVVGRRGRLHAFDAPDPKRTALVVIDMDADSCAREPEASTAAADNINRITDTLRKHDGTVAFVTSIVHAGDWRERTLGPAAAEDYQRATRPGAAGTKIATTLHVEPTDITAVKTGTSAFFPGRCDLHRQLSELSISSVLIAGLVTNICCESSARDATELEYQVTMISDANVGHSFGLHEASLSTFYRYFGDVRPTDDMIRLLTE